MNKTILLAVLALLFVGSYAQTCADHPLLSKLRTFVENNQDEFEDSEEYDNLISELDNFEANEAPAPTTLSICEDYNDQNTCCTDSFVQALTPLLKAYYGGKNKIPPKPYGQMKKMFKGLKKCAKKEAKQFMDGLKDRSQSFKDCRKEGQKAQVNWIRGAACAICVAPDQFGTIFEGSDDQLKITQESLDQYTADMEASFECLNTHNEEFKTYVEDFLEGLNGCDEVKTSIQEGLANINVQLSDGCATKKLFADGCLADQDTDLSVEEMGEILRRFLAAGDEVIVSADGVNVYQKDSETEAELDAMEAGYEVNQTEDENSAKILTCVGLFVLLTIL